MTLLFMHITKTAGGSLKDALRRSGEDIIFHYPGEQGFNMNLAYERKPKILFGHYVFGAHKAVNVEPRYACFLREPIARTISHFHHLRNNDRSAIGDKTREFERIEEYLNTAKHWEFDNFLCRVISGVANKARYGEAGRNVYSAARENLYKYFEYIGIFEDMTSSLDRLRNIVPNLPADIGSVNKGAYEREIPQETLKIVREFNVFDQLLYQDAIDLLGARKIADKSEIELGDNNVIEASE
ncbi:sulfotransferase family protein [Mesorhizobium sp. J428]|uniref:sulfotransferase family protein n=1 Tax=Mesorhizobium sp. J428 TaxID=2898440 RepID=UPI00215077BF|nr:sulfotransferase family protein [Mesorhizobium sp. J428]MCR5858811.1 sulfotransferase family protein [Mesorhizobium sp. J428]